MTDTLLKPHRCPLCGGYGRLDATPATSTGILFKDCNACKGVGVIWAFTSTPEQRIDPNANEAIKEEAMTDTVERREKENFKFETTFDESPEYYNQRYLCQNCGNWSYVYILKGILKRDISFDCKKCGCEVNP